MLWLRNPSVEIAIAAAIHCAPRSPSPTPITLEAGVLVASRPAGPSTRRETMLTARYSATTPATPISKPRDRSRRASRISYGGWQTATFVAGEMRDARRDLSRGLLMGVAGVVALYLAVNIVSLRVLGPAGLDATNTPASNVMRVGLGERGAQWIAAAIAISTLGFLSQSMLTAPRVYYAMARDGLFFRSIGKLSSGTRAPVMAIVLQGVAATIIACSGKYGEILNFEVTVDFI